MITTDEFTRRRQVILDQLDDDGIAIIVAASAKKRNGDVMYRYRQDSNFYYVTGFPEPDAVAVLIPNHADGEYILFNQADDPEQTVWHGARIGQIGARTSYGADCAYPITELATQLPKLLANRRRIYHAWGQDAAFDQRLLQWVQQLQAKSRSGFNAPHEFSHISPILNEQRLCKSTAEIALLRKAAHLSATAHQRAMQACKHAQHEYELEAELLYEFHRHGCRSPAYDSIVAGGANACILHYTANNAALNPGELVLIDAGGEYQQYAADITRTFPINGTFSAEQRAIYELVLTAQLAAIEQARVGIPWHAMQDTVTRVLIEGLLSLKILQGDAEQLLQQKAYQPFYMHSSGHWIGLDVHDVGTYRIDNQWRTLQADMAFTVEPGLYFSPENKHIDPKWRGIGIRIEDVVLVTAEGPDVLSHAAPKTISDIEALM